jgi:hypothetical protein
MRPSSGPFNYLSYTAAKDAVKIAKELVAGKRTPNFIGLLQSERYYQFFLMSGTW